MNAKRIFFILLVILAFIALLIVNILNNTFPINNKTTGEISDNLPNLFVPAGITFSIWGVIYLLLLLFVIYQTIPLIIKQEEFIPGFNRIRMLFVFSCLLNVSWIFAWHYKQMLLSMLIMLFFLVDLAFLYLALRDIRKKVKFTWKKYVCLAAPFSVYLGWITVATIANITSFLVSINWNGWGIPDYAWVIIVIIAIMAMGLFMLFRGNDFLYNLVLIWALAGIIMKRTNPAFPAQPAIVMAATAAILCLLAGVVVMILNMIARKRKKQNQLESNEQG